jgi:hypothetical protein
MKTLLLSTICSFTGTLILTPLLALVFITGRPYGDEALVPPAQTAASPTLAPETARSAFDFVNSIGVNTHLNYFDTQYGNFPLVSRELHSLGIRHLRDGVHLQNDDYNRAVYSRWVQLGKLGIRFDAVLDPRNRLGSITPALLENVDQLSGHTIESFEGPNELDINQIPDWPSVDRSYQQAIFNAAASLPDRGAIQIIGPSLAFARHASQIGNISDSLDEGNLHPYPAGKTPSIIFPEQTRLARIMCGNKNIVVTESGYHNGLNDHSDQPGVSEAAAAKYIPRLYLENFANGIARTYLYELLDESPDPALKSFQLHWGLIRSDGTEKRAFLALKNLIAELNDTAETLHPEQLVWSLDTKGATVHHLLLQKSTGEFDLVLWQDVPSYDERAQSEITNPSSHATLSFSRPAQSVVLYEPVVQSQSIHTYAHTAQIVLDVPDHPVVVRILFK